MAPGETPSEIIHRVLTTEGTHLIDTWVEMLLDTEIGEKALRTPEELREECELVFELLSDITGWAEGRIESSEWSSRVDGLARARVRQRFSPEATATFLFSLRKPLFEAFERHSPDKGRVLEVVLLVSRMLDRIHNRMMHAYLSARDDVIARQKEELLELFTPVVKLWDGVIALPLIGTLDSRRAQTVTETLLEHLTGSSAHIAIIDITGVSTVDTLVAQHLIKTVTAARLMGAECILSGIRPQIAQTIVQLGIDLSNIVTKGTLADALRHALHQLHGNEAEEIDPPDIPGGARPA